MILFFYIYFSKFSTKRCTCVFQVFFLVLYMALSISRRYSIIYIYMCIYKYFVFGFFFNKAGALINRFEYLRYPEIGYAETFRSEHFRSVSSYRSESVCRLISYVLFEMQYLISFCGQLSILHFCISFDLIFHNICFLQRKHDLIKFHNIESSFCCFSCYYGFALVSKRAWSSLRVGVGVCESLVCVCVGERVYYYISKNVKTILFF